MQTADDLDLSFLGLLKMISGLSLGLTGSTFGVKGLISGNYTNWEP